MGGENWGIFLPSSVRSIHRPLTFLITLLTHSLSLLFISFYFLCGAAEQLSYWFYFIFIILNSTIVNSSNSTEGWVLFIFIFLTPPSFFLYYFSDEIFNLKPKLRLGGPSWRGCLLYLYGRDIVNRITSNYSFFIWAIINNLNGLQSLGPMWLVHM